MLGEELRFWLTFGRDGLQMLNIYDPVSFVTTWQGQSNSGPLDLKSNKVPYPPCEGILK